MNKKSLRRTYPVVLTIILVLVVMLGLSSINVHAALTKRIIGYYTNWSIYRGHNEYYPQYIPFDKITHINYAFATITNGVIASCDEFADINKSFDGDVYNQDYKGCFNQLRKYKQIYPNVKILISIGGWSMSGGFSDVALTDASRTTFANSCISYLNTYTFFDGLDIDWEYPVGGGLETNVYRPEDKQNLTLLCAKLRQSLDTLEASTGRQYLLTMAVPAGPANIANFDVTGLNQYLDWFNLMTYDIHGAFESITNHQSALFPNPNDPEDQRLNTDSCVKTYEALGVPSSKLNIGSPYYSRGWAGVTGGSNGLFGNATGGAPGIWDDRGTNAGINPYYTIVTTYESNTAYVKYRDAYSRVPWLWSASKGIFYTYEDEISIAEKAQYVLDNNLGGVMFWEFSGDYPSHGSSLTTALYNALSGGVGPVPTPTNTPPAATPTATKTPTSTLTPSNAPTATVTKTPTATATPSVVPTSTATQTPVTTPTSVPGGTLFSDGFESGNFTAGGWTYSGASVQSTYAYAGTYAVAMSKRFYIYKTISTVGKTSVQVSYARMSGCSSSDSLAVEWYNGSAYQNIETVSGAYSWTTKTFTLPAAAANNANFRIRFIANTGTGANVYVDEVKVTAN